MRTAAVVVALAGTLLAAAACTKSKPNPGPTEPPGHGGMAMTITSTKAAYARGEQIALSVVLTNSTQRECRVSRVAEGGLTLVSLTRDGNPIAPTLVHGSYVGGFSEFLAANLVPLAPGASLTVAWTSEGGSSEQDRAALRTSTLDTLDRTLLGFWPVGEPGGYALSARYVPPILPAAPTATPTPTPTATPAADMCAASSAPAQATFTVTGGGR